ncbi:MAG: DUF58 domain-containing protein [Alphaproteobacteria bacterium]
MKRFLKSGPGKISLRAHAEELINGLPVLFSRSLHPARDMMRGAHALRRAGSGEDFWQFRDYASGDALSGIDWRRSGQGDSVFVRQKEYQSRQGFLFWTAKGPDMDFHSRKTLQRKAEAVNILILSLGLLMAARGEKIGWLGNASRTGSETAADRLENILSENHTFSSLPVEIDTVTPRTNLVLAGDFIETPDKIEQALMPLAGVCPQGLLIQVLDPLEMDMNTDGRILFENPAGSQRHLVNHAGAIRNGYIKRIEEHRTLVKMLCDNLGWTYIFHRTDKDMRETLLNTWQALNPEAL